MLQGAQYLLSRHVYFTYIFQLLNGTLYFGKHSSCNAVKYERVHSVFVIVIIKYPLIDWVYLTLNVIKRYNTKVKLYDCYSK
jgi:hypothetical protein